MDWLLSDYDVADYESEEEIGDDDYVQRRTNSYR